MSVDLLLHAADLLAQPPVLANEPHRPPEIAGAQPE